MTRTTWAIIIFLLIAWGLGTLYLRNQMFRPYEKPAPISAKIINAALAKHGNVTLKTVPNGLFFERDGETIWVVRR